MNPIKIGLIGGTGLAEAIIKGTEGVRHEVDTPFGPPSDAIIEARWNDLPVMFLSRHGPGHTIPPSFVPFRANIFALKQLGCTHIIASGAVGSLREEFRPRDLVVPDQVIDKTHRRAGTFYEKAAVHVEFAEPYCPVLRRIVIEAGRSAASAAGTASAEQSTGFSVHERGCYVCMEGPAFSTRAESLMHRLWGGDLIGMTAMPEAKLAREAEIAYCLVALVTDYDCWRQKPEGTSVKPDKMALLKEIMGNLQAASENAIGVIRRAIELISERRDSLEESPAHRALELAIWSDKQRISVEEVQRLGPLWIEYFRG